MEIRVTLGKYFVFSNEKIRVMKVLETSVLSNGKMGSTKDSMRLYL